MNRYQLTEILKVDSIVDIVYSYLFRKNPTNKQRRKNMRYTLHKLHIPYCWFYAAKGNFIMSRKNLTFFDGKDLKKVDTIKYTVLVKFGLINYPKPVNPYPLALGIFYESYYNRDRLRKVLQIPWCNTLQEWMVLDGNCGIIH